MNKSSKIKNNIRFSASTIFAVLSGLALLFDLDIATEKLRIASTVIFSIISIYLYVRNEQIKRKILDDERQNHLIKTLQENDDKQTANIAGLYEKYDLSEGKIENIQITLSRVENDVKELNVLHKYSRDLYPFLNEITVYTSKMLEDFEVENKELRQIFISSAEHLKDHLKYIIQADFKNITSTEIIEILKVKAKSVRTAINLNKLNIVNPDIFLMTVKKNILIPEFVAYANNVESMIEKEINGKRIKALEEITKNLLTNIISKVNVLHQNNNVA